MSTLPQAFKAALEADATLSGLVTYYHDTESLGRDHLELGDITLDGSPVVQPSIFIRWGTQAPMNVPTIRARRIFVELYCYDDGNAGYVTTAAMRAALFDLLHQETTTFSEPSTAYLYQWRWSGDVLELTDDRLAGAGFELSRYEGHLVQ